MRKMSLFAGDNEETEPACVRHMESELACVRKCEMFVGDNGDNEIVRKRQVRNMSLFADDIVENWREIKQF